MSAGTDEKWFYADLPIEIKSFGFRDDGGVLVNLVNCCRRSICCATLLEPCCRGGNEDCPNNQCPNKEDGCSGKLAAAGEGDR